MDFTEKFKTLSNAELFERIDNPGNYQPDAVETAKIIIASRNLSEAEISIAKEELVRQKQQQEAKTRKQRNIENKIKDGSMLLLENLNPIRSNKPSTERIITTIGIVFAAFFLFQLYNEFKMIVFLLHDIRTYWDFYTIIYFMLLLLLAAAIFPFLRRKKTGWVLLAIYLSYYAVSSIFYFFYAIIRQPSGISVLDNLFYHNDSFATCIIQITFFAGALTLICKENIRQTYNIRKINALLIIGITTLLTVLTVI